MWILIAIITHIASSVNAEASYPQVHLQQRSRSKKHIGELMKLGASGSSWNCTKNITGWGRVYRGNR
jgi:hypothetical protein